MSWAALFALLVLAAAGVFLLYRRWEPRGPGRLVLGALRWAAAAVLLLLLFNPLVPRRTDASARHRVLMDGSLSMGIPGPGGVTAWQQAVDTARQLGVADVLVFGVEPHAERLNALEGAPPGAAKSLLAPALRVAVEEGARAVTVLTDGRIGDAPEAERLARQMDVRLDVVRLGHGMADYGMAEMEAPAWAQAGEPVTVRVGVVASDAGVEDSTLAVALREGGRVVARGTVAVPAVGRVASLALRFTPEATEDRLARLEAVLPGGDAVADDDRRVAYVRIAARPAVVLVSLHPDWEPRFLAPSLQRALGLPVDGFLHVGGTRYLRLGSGPDAGTAVPVGTVRRAVEDADFLVLHGMDDAAPDWMDRAAARARRLLVLPDTGVYRSAPVALSPPAGGEWYVSDAVPASPVAALLNGLATQDLPPLAGPRLLRLPRGWWTPLVLRRGRRGVDVPMLAAGEADGHRIAVVTAAGTWRWAFNGRDVGVYDRIWSAVAGWLMGEDRVAAAAVRPARRVVARGESPRWIAPGLRPESLELAIRTAAGTVTDTVVPLVNDSGATAAMAPGDYSYHARAIRHDTVVGMASGPFSVASFSADYTKPVVPLQREGGGGVARSGSRVPLRAMAWPYLLLLLVLTVEWTLRRRWGLR